jgi:uncharacterized metal-binding protein
MDAKADSMRVRKEGRSMAQLKCAKCPLKPCQAGIRDRTLPAFCPMKKSPALVKRVSRRYLKKRVSDFYVRAALTEKGCYDEGEAREGRTLPLRPRIRELAEFAKSIGAVRVGLAFCSGLAEEASRISANLERHGLDVQSVVCCCGAADKTEHGIPPEHKIKGRDKFEAACNPLLQAELLNRVGTAFNILVGLCVGHDMLFTSNSEAPVTTLVVKDRYTGHNPVISLYTKYHKDIV